MVEFDAAIDRFLNYYRLVKNSSEHTLRNYGLDLFSFQNYLQRKSLSEIDKRGIRAYLGRALS